MSKSKTDRADYHFKVAEYREGTPWIMFELRRAPDLPCVGDGFLGFDLKAGTTYDEARSIARFLNDNVTVVTHTHDLR